MNRMAGRILMLLGCLAMGVAVSPASADPEFYGIDPGGTRYSPLTDVTPQNVGQLEEAWTFHTGDMVRRTAQEMHRTKLEVMPILVGERLLICTSFNEVIALDPGTGRELWRFDPKIKTNYRPANLFNCRGVAVWHGATGGRAPCAERVFTVTNDARLIALDLTTGQRCTAFGKDGEVKIEPGMELVWPGEWQMTSAPVVDQNLIIVGSSVGDNARVDAPRGTVRAFDARDGSVTWTWDPIPTSADDPAAKSWGDGWRKTGAANVWAPISVDAKRHWVFLPTTSPSPDFYGGLRPGDDHHANSVVALDAQSGRLIWDYQIVHHDVWDYDLASEPTLATMTIDGLPRDVVIQGTKQGLIFVLDRDTGVPVLPVEERAVPGGGATGEMLSATQPFPKDLPRLGPEQVRPEDAWGLTPWDRKACRDQIAGARNEGLYTPPSEQGTILFPFTGGGINWGGVAVDPAHAIVYANSSNLIHIVTLFPADRYDEMRERYPGKEVSPQDGAPFGMKRDVLLSPLGLPCNPPPWGTLSAVDLNARKILWQVPIGTVEQISHSGVAIRYGTPSFGGPLATASGLVFIGATLDQYLRAFDGASGRELWTGRLPASGVATPTSYVWQGRQYVVIAAGGDSDAGVPANDAIVAFALPGTSGSTRTLWSRMVDRPGGRFELGLLVVVLVILGLAVLLVRLSAWRKRVALRRLTAA